MHLPTEIERVKSVTKTRNMQNHCSPPSHLLHLQIRRCRELTAKGRSGLTRWVHFKTSLHVLVIHI